jgi:hypothetical protein
MAKDTILSDRLFNGYAWTISRHTRPNGTGYYQLTELAGRTTYAALRTDFPVIYENGNVVYDSPERLPKAVKDWTKKVLQRHKFGGR